MAGRPPCSTTSPCQRWQGLAGCSPQHKCKSGGCRGDDGQTGIHDVKLWELQLDFWLQKAA